MDLSIQTRRRLLLWALQAWDIGACSAVLGGLWWLQQPGVEPLGALPVWQPAALASGGSVVSLWLTGSAGLFHQVLSSATNGYRSRRLERGAGEARAIARALGLGIALSSLLALLIGVPHVSLALMAQAWVSVTAIVVASRFALRGLLGVVRRSGRNLRQALVIGSGQRARQLVWDLIAQPDLGYRVLGCIDDGAQAAVAGVPLLGGIEDIDRVLAGNVVDEVVIALSPSETFGGACARVMRACERQGVSVTLPVNFFDTELLPLQLDSVEGTPVLRYGSHRVRGWPAFLKRAFDLGVALLLLILLTPLFAAVALLIRLTSPGPVFFVQERVGLHKRVFRLFKFRTMVADAEARLQQILHLNEVSGPVFKVRNDPRITRLGSWLRRTSIDELPQLINVMLGDMSLVGPRPLPLRDVRGFCEDSMRRRFSVKPGITCFWQVSGRSSLGFDQWMELDIRYIENWSLGLDLKILLLTLPAVLRGNGAH